MRLKENYLDCVVKEPYQPARHEPWLKNDLATLQSVVGGYLEVIHIDQHLAALCNDEARLWCMPPNVRIGRHEICGTVIFVGIDGGEIANLRPIDRKSLMILYSEGGNADTDKDR